MENNYLVQKSAKDVRAILEKIIPKLPQAPLIGVCGGSSILPVLESLNTMSHEEEFKTTLSRSELLLIDERLVPINHSDSNCKIISNGLPLKTESLEAGFVFYPFNTDNIERGLKEYSRILAAHDNAFDLVFLGVGEDGHVASLFPGMPWPDNPEIHFFTLEGSPKPPSQRMSASPQTIKKAKNVVVLFFGEGKREAYKRFIENTESENDCPVLLTKSVPSLYVLRDIIL